MPPSAYGRRDRYRLLQTNISLRGSGGQLAEYSLQEQTVSRFLHGKLVDGLNGVQQEAQAGIEVGFLQVNREDRLSCHVGLEDLAVDVCGSNGSRREEH